MNRMKRLFASLALLLVVCACSYVLLMYTPLSDWLDGVWDDVATALGVQEDGQMWQSASATASAEIVQSVNTISEEQIAQELVAGILDFRQTITLQLDTPPGNLREDEMSGYMLARVEEAFTVIRKEYPEIFWMSLGTYDIQWETSRLKSGVALTLHMEYCHSPAEMRALQEQIGAQIDSILAEVPADAYGAVKYFHDWIVQNTVYASQVADLPSMEGYEYAFNLDGVFLNGSAVCEGYTKAFKALCDRAGIPCRIVFGVADGENHGWNYVQLDGGWYLVDCTWDDPVASVDILGYDHFLRGFGAEIDGKTVSSLYRPDAYRYPALSAADYPAVSGLTGQSSSPQTHTQDLALHVRLYAPLYEGGWEVRSGEPVAAVSAENDAGQYTFSLADYAGAANHLFAIDSATGELSVAAEALTGGVYTVCVQVTDGTLVSVGTFQIEVLTTPDEQTQVPSDGEDPNQRQGRPGWVA